MSSVVRVKRLLEEEPLDSFVLKSKRQKIDSDDIVPEAHLSAILKFAGTVEDNAEKHVLEHIKKFSKPIKIELENEFKKRSFNILNKLRSESQKQSKINRYKVINSFRSSLVVSDSPVGKEESYTVYDIQLESDENTVHENQYRISEPKYVYDLYYTNSDDLGHMEEYVSIYPFSDELMFGTNSGEAFMNSDSDSDDSNAENNWRNTYPDESDIDSVNEDDMMEAMKNCNISNDLSSDNEEFVHSIDTDADLNFNEDIDESDVRRYGEMYARFKARNKIDNDSKPDLYCGDIEEED